MRHTQLRLIAAFAAALTTATVATLNSSQLPPEPLALRPPALPGFVCGTPDIRADVRGFRTLDAATDGQPLWFTQEPSILTPDYTGAVSLSNFVVTGDVETIRFAHTSPVNPGDIETWTRTETQEINGRLVSVFNPTWDAGALTRLLGTVPWGWDRPSVT